MHSVLIDRRPTARSRWWVGGDGPSPRSQKSAFTIVEVMVAVFLLTLLSVALFGAFSIGLSAVESFRENLRATQIMMQKMETIRLLTWSQGTNATVAPLSFIDVYDPSGTNSGTAGVVYRGTITITPAPESIPASYRTNMRLITATVTWTNKLGRRAGIFQARDMQTLVSRYGLQNYVY